MSKRTVQKYMRLACGPQPWGLSWATFLRNHASQIWDCDFLQTHDAFFRPIFAFFMVELGSRAVVHVGVTRSPTSRWTTQRLRDATPFGEGPRFIIRDNDDKYGSEFDRVAKVNGTRAWRTPYRAPLANATMERFVGTARRDCLDHVVILSARHLLATLRAYVSHFNGARPHQELAQQIPCPPSEAAEPCAGARVVAVLGLGGLHHECRWAA